MVMRGGLLAVNLGQTPATCSADTAVVHSIIRSDAGWHFVGLLY
jgi:hypothetical protein